MAIPAEMSKRITKSMDLMSQALELLEDRESNKQLMTQHDKVMMTLGAKVREVIKAGAQSLSTI